MSLKIFAFGECCFMNRLKHCSNFEDAACRHAFVCSTHTHTFVVGNVNIRVQNALCTWNSAEKVAQIFNQVLSHRVICFIWAIHSVMCCIGHSSSANQSMTSKYGRGERTDIYSNSVSGLAWCMQIPQTFPSSCLPRMVNISTPTLPPFLDPTRRTPLNLSVSLHVLLFIPVFPPHCCPFSSHTLFYI